MTHIKIVHSENIGFSCDVCSRVFTNQTYLKDHFRNMHDIKKTLKLINSKVKCDVCNLSLKTSRSLDNHVKSVHGKGKCFQCISCDKAYFWKQDLKKHIVAVHAQDSII